jgi:acyl carrier protein
MTDKREITGYLSGLWEKLLGKPVAPDVDFFDAGGNSLTGVKMIMEVQETYSVDLDLETFFEEPSIAKLAESIERSAGKAAANQG